MFSAISLISKCIVKVTMYSEQMRVNGSFGIENVGYY